MTDLRNLEKQGRLRRNHGGAVSIEPLLYEHFQHASSYKDQIEKHADEKRRIALAAARLISDGDTIVLTSGTTTNQVARSIPADLQVTVVTSTVNVAMELSNRRGVSVFVTGGFLHGEWFSLVGPAAVQALSAIFPDKAFIGANGVHPDHSVTAYHPDEAALNNALVRQSREKIVVADHSKLSVVATHLICPVKEVSLIITDTGATDQAIAGFIRQREIGLLEIQGALRHLTNHPPPPGAEHPPPVFLLRQSPGGNLAGSSVRQDPVSPGFFRQGEAPRHIDGIDPEFLQDVIIHDCQLLNRIVNAQGLLREVQMVAQFGVSNGRDPGGRVAGKINGHPVGLTMIRSSKNSFA